MYEYAFQNQILSPIAVTLLSVKASQDIVEPPLNQKAADVTIAVVSHNTRDLLERCLLSIAALGARETIVIDNASPDGSAEHIRTRFPDVRVIANTHNRGYGAAANQALQTARTPLVLLLNADTELRADCVQTLAREAARFPRAGILAPLILDPTGKPEPSCFPFPGTMDWLLENEPVATIVRRVPRLLARTVSLTPASATRPVPWVLGCALLLRREALDAIRGFDEKYFMYYEEVDLCRRIWDAGWEVRIVPDARVTHVGGASTSQYRAAMLIRHFESTLQYYRRNVSGTRLAFWLTLLWTKRVGLLLRDSALLVVKRDPDVRERLRDQRRAWLANLGFSTDMGHRRPGGDRDRRTQQDRV